VLRCYSFLTFYKYILNFCGLDDFSNVNISNTILNRSKGYCLWVILLNLVHTVNVQLLAIFYNLPANEHGFLPKPSKI